MSALRTASGPAASRETIMHNGKWLLWLLLLAATSTSGFNFNVGIGDDFPRITFYPTPLTINVGDTVMFYDYASNFFHGPHNVVADDGSFRCARGCDGEGGDGAPASNWMFTRTFSTPGVVSYHDEVSRTTGVIIVQGGTGFAIGPGITGAWYDPSQSGQGLHVEVLSDNRFYASWFTFNPAGTQAWVTGVGTYSGHTATITEVQLPTGGRFPTFDPHEIVRNAWGTLRFSFTDCNHATMDFNSVAGSGRMSLTRLTQPAGLICP